MKIDIVWHFNTLNYIKFINLTIDTLLFIFIYFIFIFSWEENLKGNEINMSENCEDKLKIAK